MLTMALEHPVKSKDVNPLRPVQRRHRAIRDIITACALLATLNIAQAAFLLEIDTDGADDGPVTFNPNFSFGGDTTTASSSVTSLAFGTTGGDSIFGGDGVVEPDTYVYTYTPSVNADNLVIPPGTDLGSGNLATGFTGGGTGTYRVYATWPFTDNVTGGPTRFTLSTTGATDVVIDIDQNGGGAGTGDEWIPLGDIELTDPNADIMVTQIPTTSNSFISMRAYGLLFEALDNPDGPAPDSVPVPAGNRGGWLILIVLATAVGLVVIQRRG